MTMRMGPYRPGEANVLKTLYDNSHEPRRPDATALCYGILLHHNFPQFKQLLQAIYSKTAYFIVHIDQKADLEFRKQVETLCTTVMERSQTNNIAVLSRENSIKVTLFAFPALLPELLLMSHSARLWSYSHFILLSGSDFPLVPGSLIERFYLSPQFKYSSFSSSLGSDTLNQLHHLSLVELPCKFDLPHYALPSGRFWMKTGKKIQWGTASQWVT